MITRRGASPPPCVVRRSLSPSVPLCDAIGAPADGRDREAVRWTGVTLLTRVPGAVTVGWSPGDRPRGSEAATVGRSPGDRPRGSEAATVGRSPGDGRA